MMNATPIITSILIALIFTIIFIISRIIAKIWCMPKKMPNTKTPGGFQLPYENIEFSNSNITLKGWFIPSNLDINSSDRIAIVGHSIRGSSSILAAVWDSGIKAIVSSSAFADPILITINQLKRYHFPKRPFVWIVFRFIQRWSNKSISYMFPRNFMYKIEASMHCYMAEKIQSFHRTTLIFYTKNLIKIGLNRT